MTDERRVDEEKERLGDERPESGDCEPEDLPVEWFHQTSQSP